MIARTVCPEMVSFRHTSMRQSDIIEPLPSSMLGSPEKKFQIHHVVDNRVMRPIAFFSLSKAMIRGCLHGVVKFCQFVRTFQQDIFVIVLFRKAIGMTVATKHLKSHIVTGNFTRQRLQQFCKMNSFFLLSPVHGCIRNHTTGLPEKIRLSSRGGLTIFHDDLPASIALGSFEEVPIAFNVLCICRLQ